MNRNFSENLRKIRKENNLSQEQLAEELAVSRQAISKWESGSAYPEMDKIIALCEKFNINIDDLLYRDIKEIKGEEESKKKINTMIDDFLKYITNTINLFSNMSFKSKIKCLFEQIIIIIVLIILSSVLVEILGSLFSNILRILPYEVHYFLFSILKSLMMIFCLAASIIILLHVFKTRYLDYYTEAKNENDNKEAKEEINAKTTDKVELKKENKIVIRDPKHSEYHFINGIWKVMVLVIKFFALCISLGFIGVLIGLGISIVVSLLFIKTGLIFVGTFIALLSSITIIGIILLIIFNFVFTRKGNKKLMIYSFIIAVLSFGLGCGLFVTGCVDFEIITDDTNNLTTKIYEMEMIDNLYFNTNREIEYIPSENANIKIEYETNKHCQLTTSHLGEYGVSIWIDCYEIPQLIKDMIKDINKKKIYVTNYDIKNIKVYTTQENINKMMENKQLKESMQKEINNIREEYEQELVEKEKTINNMREEYEQELVEKEKTINEFREKVDELENKQ